jgi:hypothetical protein
MGSSVWLTGSAGRRRSRYRQRFGPRWTAAVDEILAKLQLVQSNIKKRPDDNAKYTK